MTMKNTSSFLSRGLLAALWLGLSTAALAQDKTQQVRVSTWVPAQHA